MAPKPSILKELSSFILRGRGYGECVVEHHTNPPLENLHSNINTPSCQNRHCQSVLLLSQSAIRCMLVLSHSVIRCMLVLSHSVVRYMLLLSHSVVRCMLLSHSVIWLHIIVKS